MRVKNTYHFQEVDPFIPPAGFTTWLKSTAKEYSKSLLLNYIFCSDAYLLRINQKHLNHDYYTDIITFDLSTTTSRIEADIFVSIDRVKENANKESSSFAEELTRVMSHGVFHLLGFNDKTQREALKMRELEQKAVSQIL